VRKDFRVKVNCLSKANEAVMRLMEDEKQLRSSAAAARSKALSTHEGDALHKALHEGNEDEARSIISRGGSYVANFIDKDLNSSLALAMLRNLG